MIEMLYAANMLVWGVVAAFLLFGEM